MSVFVYPVLQCPLADYSVPGDIGRRLQSVHHPDIRRLHWRPRVRT